MGTKVQPFKDHLMSNVWQKCQMNWMRKTELFLEPTFNYTFNHKTNITKRGKIKLCKAVQHTCRYTQTKFRMTNVGVKKILVKVEN